MKTLLKSHFLTLILVIADVIALSLIWRESWVIRDAMNHRFGPINALENYSAVLPKLVIGWILTLAFFKQYAHRGKISSLNQTSNIIKAAVGLLVVTIVIDFLFKRYDLGRAVIAYAAVGHAVYLYVSRTSLRYGKQLLREQGYGLTRVAIIGAGETGRRVALRIQNHPEVGYELAGFIDRDARALGEEIAGVPVIGDGGEMVDLLLRYRVEEVFLAIPSLSQNETLNLVVQCEAANVHFKIVKNDLIEVISDKVKIDDIGDFPVIQLGEGRLTPLNSALKRLVDYSITVPLLIAISPLCAMIAVAIKMSSKGPVIFSHDRVGQDGKVFRLYKFRTMTAVTEPYAVAPGDQNDSRITPLGRFLRSTSLDELPQFWNVIKGDMSVVGPRPEMPFIVAQYEPWQRRRLDVPQGITGLWQIAGRKQLPLHFNLEYDFYYIRNWSLVLDLSILLRTIPAVVFRRGAF